MNINSKFDVGDYVWFQNGTKYHTGVITKISGWEANEGFLYYLNYISNNNKLSSRTDYEHNLYGIDEQDLIIKDMFIDNIDKIKLEMHDDDYEENTYRV